MLRMQDFFCVQCGKKWEELILKGEDRVHCGEVAQKLVGAPAVHYKEGQWSPALGKTVSGSREIDQELEKNNQWVPTPYEAKQISDMTEEGMTPVAIGKGPDENKIAKHVDKALERMHSEGLYSESS